MKISITQTAVYPWTHCNDYYFRGYFFKDNEYYSGELAIFYLEKHLNCVPEDISRELAALNGVFSFIWAKEDSVLFAVDRLRSLPLFYAIVNDELCVGDAADAVTSSFRSISIDPLSEEEYIKTNLFISGSSTLVTGLYQVQASSYCLFQNCFSGVKEYSYFQLEHSDFEYDIGYLKDSFHNAYQAVGKHLVESLRGRTAVIPLSGGADSRMVLHLLKAENYKNIICYTYGRPGNKESEISRQIAAEYNCPWFMVPYTKDTWERLRNSSDLKAYYQKAFNYVSTPHLQDFPAVKWLKEHGKLPSDSVFVPGHSGDLIAGSHITAEFLRPELSQDDFLQTIYTKFYDSSSPQDLSSPLREKINMRFSPVASDDLETLASQSEWFNIQERQAKYIVNSVRVYEFFGYEWLIPLWDNVLFEYWRRVPISFRYKRALYFEAIGPDSIISTNTPTAYSTFTDYIRSTSGIPPLARRIKRMLEYYKSNLYIEHLFPRKDYLLDCLGKRKDFVTIALICKQQIAYCKKVVQNHENE